MTDWPREEPREVVQGDTIVWLKDLGPDITPAKRTLKYRIIQSGKTQNLTVAAWTEDPNIYAVSLTPVLSATLDPEDSALAGWLEWTDASFGDQRLTIFDGRLNVLPDPASTNPDPSNDIGHVRRVLKAIDATIENTATAGQKRYAIRDRSLERMDPSELLEWREYYRRRLRELETLEKRKRGQRPSNLIGVSFGPHPFLPPDQRYRGR